MLSASSSPQPLVHLSATQDDKSTAPTQYNEVIHNGRRGASPLEGLACGTMHWGPCMLAKDACHLVPPQLREMVSSHQPATLCLMVRLKQ